MIDISLLDPAAIAFVLGFVIPLFVYTTRGVRPNPTGNRLARSNVTGFLDSLLSDNGTNITLVSGTLIVPLGSKTSPTIQAGDSDSGIYFVSNLIPGIAVDGRVVTYFNDGNINIISGGGLFWSSTNDAQGAVDLNLIREGAAIMQQGDDSATPIAQTYKGPDSSGTNVVCTGDLTVAPGRGTGTGTGGTFRIATAPAGASGSAQNALVDRLIIGGAGVGSMADLTVSSLTGAAGYRGIATMNSGTTIANVTATAARSGAVILTQILQYVGDVNSQAGFSTAVQSVRAGAFEIVAVGSRAPVDNAPIAWFVLR